MKSHVALDFYNDNHYTKDTSTVRCWKTANAKRIYHTPTYGHFISAKGKNPAWVQVSVPRRYCSVSGRIFKKFGLHEKITRLEGIGNRLCRTGGVQPNPRSELVYEGIALVETG
jgi:alcohol dehydrogenase YqhD (iron-dependent ADH family)